jgi:hypothetical protein
MQPTGEYAALQAAAEAAAAASHIVVFTGVSAVFVYITHLLAAGEYAALQAAAEAAGAHDSEDAGDGQLTGKDSRKRRQTILSELLDAVPLAAASLLAGGNRRP